MTTKKMEKAETEEARRLPTASTTNPKKILDSFDYEVYKDVPVFVEHTRKLPSGRELKFGKKELEALCKKCNERINKTGDFAPIVLGHTSPDPNVNPPRVGYAGPFTLGYLNEDRDKYAILAEFRIDKDKTRILRDYPRRSAELWATESYEDMYLDPISLLGANTPYSDMGVFYKKEEDGVERVRYEFCEPGASNAFMPGPVQAKEKGKYGMYDNVSDEQRNLCDMVIDAVSNMAEIKQIPQMLEQLRGALEEVNKLKNAAQTNVVDTTSENPLEAEPGQIDELSQTPESNDVAPEESGVELPSPGNNDVDFGDATPVEETDDDSWFDDEYNFDAANDEQTTEQFPGSQEPDQTNETEGNEMSKNALQSKIQEVEKRLAELEAGSTKRDGDWRLLGKATRGLYKDRDDKARYAKLQDLSRTRMFDVDKEFEQCQYDKMSDKEFQERVASIEKNYRRTPDAIHIPYYVATGGGVQYAERPGAVQYEKKRAQEFEDEVMREALTDRVNGRYRSSAEIRAEVAKRFNQPQ